MNNRTALIVSGLHNGVTASEVRSKLVLKGYSVSGVFSSSADDIPRDHFDLGVVCPYGVNIGASIGRMDTDKTIVYYDTDSLGGIQ